MSRVSEREETDVDARGRDSAIHQLSFKRLIVKIDVENRL